MHQSRVSAAVLIGGRSRRMGEPKAIMRLTPNAPTLIETVVLALQDISREVMLVGSAGWPLPGTLDLLPRVNDGGQGATDGVIAALDAAASDLCLVVGCDMPFLDPPLLREMIAIARDTDRGVIVRDATGPHPLHAIYRRADLPRIRAIVGYGQRSLAVIAGETGMVALDLDAPGRPEAHRWSVFNANTPDDLAIARAHAGQQR